MPKPRNKDMSGYSLNKRVESRKMSNLWDRFTRWRRGGVPWESSSEYEQKYTLEINESGILEVIPVLVKKPTLYKKISDVCRKVKQFLSAIVLFLYGCCPYVYHQSKQFYRELSYLGCYQYFCLLRVRFSRWWSPECDQTEQLVPIMIDGTIQWICPGCLKKPTRFKNISNYFRRKFAKWNQATIFDVIRVPISVISFVLIPLKIIIWIIRMCGSMLKTKNTQTQVQVPSNEASTDNDNAPDEPEGLLQLLCSEIISDTKQFLSKFFEFLSFLYGCCQSIYFQIQEFCYEIAQFYEEISFYGHFQYFCLQSQQFGSKIYQFTVQVKDNVKYGLTKIQLLISRLFVNCKKKVMKLIKSVISFVLTLVVMPFLKLVNQMCSPKLKSKRTQTITVQVSSNEASTETDNTLDDTKELLQFLSSENERLESLLKSQMKIFECPVCFEIMKSPRRIFGCSNDHFICSECLKSSSIQCCPICREDYETNQPRRRFKSEDLLALISSENPESSKVETGKGKSRRKRIRRKKTTEE